MRLIRKFIIVLLFCNFNFTIAQNWQYQYNSQDNILYFSVFETNINHKIIACGGAQNYVTHKSDGLIVALDSTGKLIKSKELHIAGYSILLLGLAGIDSLNNYIFTGIKNDTTSPYLTSFSSFVLDSNFSLLSYKNYYLPLGYLFYNMNSNYNKDGNLIVFGQTYDINSNALHFIYVFKPNGDSLIATTFNNFSGLFINDCISDKTNGGYKIITEPYQSTSARIFYFDSLLTFNKSDTVLFNFGLGHFYDSKYSFKDFDGSNYLISGSYSIVNLISNQNIFISKLNTNSNASLIETITGKPIIKDRPAAYRALDFINKNNIYLGAMSNYNSPFAPDTNFIMITDVDSNLNIKWQRFIGGDATYTLLTVTATRNGGCLLNATRYDAAIATFPTQSDAIIFKMDSLGTLTTISHNSIIKIRKYLIYPNPTQNYFKVSGFINHAITIELFDARGKLILTEKITSNTNEITTEKLNKGIYFYKITDNDYSETGKWIKD